MFVNPSPRPDLPRKSSTEVDKMNKETASMLHTEPPTLAMPNNYIQAINSESQEQNLVDIILTANEMASSPNLTSAHGIQSTQNQTRKPALPPRSHPFNDRLDQQDNCSLSSNKSWSERSSYCPHDCDEQSVKNKKPPSIPPPIPPRTERQLKRSAAIEISAKSPNNTGTLDAFSPANGGILSQSVSDRNNGFKNINTVYDAIEHPKSCDSNHTNNMVDKFDSPRQGYDYSNKYTRARFQNDPVPTIPSPFSSIAKYTRDAPSRTQNLHHDQQGYWTQSTNENMDTHGRLRLTSSPENLLNAHPCRKQDQSRNGSVQFQNHQSTRQDRALQFNHVSNGLVRPLFTPPLESAPSNYPFRVTSIEEAEYILSKSPSQMMNHNSMQRSSSTEYMTMDSVDVNVMRKSSTTSSSPNWNRKDSNTLSHPVTNETVLYDRPANHNPTTPNPPDLPSRTTINQQQNSQDDKSNKYHSRQRDLPPPPLSSPPPPIPERPDTELIIPIMKFFLKRKKFLPSSNNTIPTGFPYHSKSIDDNIANERSDDDWKSERSSSQDDSVSTLKNSPYPSDNQQDPFERNEYASINTLTKSLSGIHIILLLYYSIHYQLNYNILDLLLSNVSIAKRITLYSVNHFLSFYLNIAESIFCQYDNMIIRIIPDIKVQNRCSLTTVVIKYSILIEFFSTLLSLS